MKLANRGLPKDVNHRRILELFCSKFAKDLVVKKPSKPIRAIAWLLAFLTAIPAVYVLSVGPVIWAWEKWNWANNDFAAPLIVIYRPLESIAKSPSYAGKLLRTYVRFWGGNVAEPDEK